MKKHLIAAAVAGAFVVPAMAQVTVYGRAEVTTELGRKVETRSSTTTGAVTVANGATQLDGDNIGSFAAAARATGTAKPTFTVQDGNNVGDGSSRFGFRGEEDLGGGLKALFQMEAGVNLDDGSDGNGGGTLFARTAMVGLSGGFGRVTLGRQVNPAFSIQGAGQVLGTMNSYTDGAASVIPTAGGARSSHSVMYNTPSMGGISASLLLAAAEGKGTSRNANNNVTNNDKPGMSLGLSYAAGPLYLGLGWDKRETASTTVVAATSAPVSSAAREVDQLVVSAAYDLGVAKLFFSWTEAETAIVNTAAATRDNLGGTETAMTIGASMPMGAGLFFVEYGTSETDDLRDTTTTGAVTTNNLLGISAKGEETAYSIGYRHSLSKRTWAQAAYGMYEIENTANATALGIRVRDEVKTSGFALTLHHSF